MARSGWAAAAVALMLMAVFGSEAAEDIAVDAHRGGVRPLASSLTSFPRWGVVTAGAGGDVVAAIAVKMLVLLAGVFLLAMVAGRTSSPGAAFLAGWGAFMLASALAAAAGYGALELLVLQGDLAHSRGSLLAPLVEAMNGGVIFALYTGALVGGAVAITRRTTMTPFAGPGIEPPLPIAPWPPTPVADAVPSAVPPSPAWTPPGSLAPLPAIPLGQRGVGSRPVPSLPGEAAVPAAEPEPGANADDT